MPLLSPLLSDISHNECSDTSQTVMRVQERVCRSLRGSGDNCRGNMDFSAHQSTKISLCHTAAELRTCSDSFKGSIFTPPQAGFGTFSPILEHQHWPFWPGFLLSSFSLPTPSHLGTRKQTSISGSCRICRVWLSAGWRLLGDRPGCL